MRVLVACEFSGVVREAFRKRGHDAWSCDLIATNDPHHLHGNVLSLLKGLNDFNTNEPIPWDLMIAHPPCTALCVSGNRYYAGSSDRMEALKFVERLLAADIPKICLENPVGVISTHIRPPDQYIQPYEFGEDASKKTGLWLKGLPPLTVDPLLRVPGRVVDGKERWGNQTDSGQNKLGPSEDRGLLRSITYQGIADAMAEQWG